MTSKNNLKNKHNNTILSILLNFCLPISSLILVVVFYQQNIILTSLLIILSVLILLIKKSKRELILFIITGISGSLAEIIAIYFGVWTYSKAYIFGIPLWLPILWGIAAIFIKRMYEDINLVITKFKK